MRGRHLDAANRTELATVFGAGPTTHRGFHHFPEDVLRPIEIAANGRAKVIHELNPKAMRQFTESFFFDAGLPSTL